MYQQACATFLLFAFILNWQSWRMLALTLLVGASIFVPTPQESAEQFYVFCISAEIFVGALSWAANTKASRVIADICMLLIIAHIMGYVLDGSQTFSPYRLIVKLLEFSQIVACVALSPIIAPILRNRDEATT